MNLFKKAKDNPDKHLCQSCGRDFKPDNRNLKRGWGLFCSKSCSSKWRTKISNLSKSEYTTEVRDYRLRQLGLD